MLRCGHVRHTTPLLVQVSEPKPRLDEIYRQIEVSTSWASPYLPKCFVVDVSAIQLHCSSRCRSPSWASPYLPKCFVVDVSAIQLHCSSRWRSPSWASPYLPKCCAGFAQILRCGRVRHTTPFAGAGVRSPSWASPYLPKCFVVDVSAIQLHCS